MGRVGLGVALACRLSSCRVVYDPLGKLVGITRTFSLADRHKPMMPQPGCSTYAVQIQTGSPTKPGFLGKSATSLQSRSGAALASTLQDSKTRCEPQLFSFPSSISLRGIVCQPFRAAILAGHELNEIDERSSQRLLAHRKPAFRRAARSLFPLALGETVFGEKCERSTDVGRCLITP